MSSDLDDDIANATISFVPQVGAGAKKKSKPEPPVPTSGPAASSGFADMNSIYQHQPPPPNGYGIPGAPAGFSPNNAFYQPPSPAPTSSYNAYQQPPPPNCGGYPLSQPMLGQPVYGSPMGMNGSPYNMNGGNNAANGPYPGAGSYMPPGNNNGQMMMMMVPPPGGAMVLLVEDSRDMDFRTPLCGSESFMGCLNAFFLPYCLNARQQNMLRDLPLSVMRSGQSGGRYVADSDTAERTSRAISSFNACCGVAFLFDIGRAAAAFFFPGIVGTVYLVNGLCVQTMQNRQQIRSRFGIASAQVTDCCASYFCTCCAINQNQQEMKLRGANPRLVAGDDGKPSPSRMN